MACLYCSSTCNMPSSFFNLLTGIGKFRSTGIDKPGLKPTEHEPKVVAEVGLVKDLKGWMDKQKELESSSPVLPARLVIIPPLILQHTPHGEFLFCSRICCVFKKCRLQSKKISSSTAGITTIASWLICLSNVNKKQISFQQLCHARLMRRTVVSFWKRCTKINSTITLHS